MMLPTHVIVGLAAAIPLAITAPDLAPAALAGAVVGSVVPDLDMYAGHRRTLHYPTVYPVAALIAAVGAVTLATPLAVAVTFALLGAALHCQMDRLGGGLELRPWEGRSDRAVYDHVRRRWRRPRRWVRYDGAPEDFLLSLAVGGPLLLIVSEPFNWVVLAALAVGGFYAAFRRQLADLATVVFGQVPDRLRQHVPDRYRP